MPRVSVVLAAIGISASVSFRAARFERSLQDSEDGKSRRDGGFDYVYADAVGRRLYVPRNGQLARMTVFDLDTLDPGW